MSDSAEKEMNASGPGSSTGLLIFMMAWAWLGWVGFDLVSSYSYQGGLFADPTLTTAMRLALFCTLALTNGMAVIAIGCLVRLVQLLFQRYWRWLGKLLVVLVVLGSLLAVVASWASYDSAGAFIDIQALRFTLAFPVLTVEHAVHLDLLKILLVIGIFLVVSFLLARFGPGCAGWAIKRRLVRRTVTTVALALLVTSLIGSLLGHLRMRHSGELLARHPDTGVVSTVGQRWQSCRQNHLGPLPSFLATISFGRGDVPALAPLRRLRTTGRPLTRPPIVPLEEYVKDVDTAGIRNWNVIVVLVESLRTDVLSDGGGKHPVMPNLEALAEESLVYLNVYAQSSHSNYADLCVLNSQYPLRSQWEYFYPREPGYPRTFLHDILARFGYATSVFSSQDENWGGMIRLLDPSSFDRFFHSGDFPGFRYSIPPAEGEPQSSTRTKLSGKVDDSLTVNEAVKWIATQPRPFFMYMNLQSSHIPYVVPENHAVQFGPRELDFTIRLGRFPREKVDVVKRRYWDSLNYVDMQLGKLVAGLKAEEKWDSTVLVVSGDTGQAFYEHGFCAHANQLYDEVMKVPLVVRYPGVKHAVSHLSLQHLDVPPMVLSLLQLPPHPGFQGDWAAVSAGQPPPRFLVVQTTLANQVGVVWDGWKLLYDLDFGTFHLYHLDQDPAEQMDVSRDSPERVSELSALLADWVCAQLEYYQDPARQAQEFAPRLGAPDASQ
ncbi:MAG: sulfatase [Pirellulaceae bacterium]